MNMAFKNLKMTFYLKYIFWCDVSGTQQVQRFTAGWFTGGGRYVNTLHSCVFWNIYIYLKYIYAV